jgi:hypothetical protein
MMMKEDRKNTLKEKIMNAAIETSGEGKVDIAKEASIEQVISIEPGSQEKNENMEIDISQKVPDAEVVSHSVADFLNPAVKMDSHEKYRESSEPDDEPNTAELVVHNQTISKEKNKRKEKPVKVKNEKKGSGKKILYIPMIVFCSIFLTSGVLVAGRIMSNLKDSDREVNVQDNSGKVVLRDATGLSSVEIGDLVTTTGDEQQRLNELAENSRVYCIISSSPYFKDSKSKGSLFISNPQESEFYTQVIIKTKGDEKEMYVSPLLAPDEKIEYDYLASTEFEKGSYDANAYFNYFKKDGDTGMDSDYAYLGSMCAEINVMID